MKDNVLKRYFNMKAKYKDPDGYGNSPDYYAEYREALNNHVEHINNHVEHINNPINIRYELEENGNKGIKIIKSSEEGSDDKSIRLKSDQFGFSFATIYSNKFHPYDAYLLLFDDEDLKKEDKSSPFSKVYRWVMDTRLVGGSFLWPENSTYNAARGGVCNYNYMGKRKRRRSFPKKKGDIVIDYYIQDRVDLTLFEIKEVYDSNILKIKELSSKERKKLYDGKDILLTFDKKNIVNKNKLKKNNLMTCLFNIKNGTPTDTYKFLSIFGVDEKGFKNYVDYFAFNDFVSADYKKVKDIYRKNNEYIDDRVDLIRKYNGEINDYSCNELINKREDTDYSSATSREEFEKMFNLLVDLIEKRGELLKKGL